eukprot:482373-Rhodomonas_salina.4
MIGADSEGWIEAYSMARRQEFRWKRLAGLRNFIASGREPECKSQGSTRPLSKGSMSKED